MRRTCLSEIESRGGGLAHRRQGAAHPPTVGCGGASGRTATIGADPERTELVAGAGSDVVPGQRAVSQIYQPRIANLRVDSFATQSLASHIAGICIVLTAGTELDVGRRSRQPAGERRTEMANAYYSMVIDAAADTVWTTVRDFSAYGWAGSGYSAVIEDGRRSDAVGAVRRIGDDGKMRQTLLALSDVDRSLTYDVLPGSPIEVDNYRACLRIRPIVDANQTFVEWSATFDCAPADAEHWRRFYAEDRFPTWLAALREHMTA